MRFLPRPVLAIGAALALVLALACRSDDEVVTMDVVGTVPWPAAQSHVYVLVDEDGEEIGSAILSVATEGDKTRLTQLFTNQTNSDTTSVLVDPVSLKPESARRVIKSGDDEDTLEVTYSEEGVLIRQGDKQSGLTVPPHAYDNDTSLFLWRTLPFAEDYTASYVTIITNRRNRETVTLTVLGKETVTVPAGRFEAWKLEVRAGGVRQIAWFADTPARPLVKYDNSRDTIFELTSLDATD